VSDTLSYSTRAGNDNIPEPKGEAVGERSEHNKAIALNSNML
jgi:hypothetical protein